MLTIRTVLNGWLITSDEGGTPTTVVVENNGGARSYVKVLQEVIEALGFVGSRYDAERLAVVVGPGDKHGGHLTTEGLG